MLLGARQFFERRGAKLPYDAEVEYLESSGTQWIDTGYSFNSATDKVELVFELLTTTPNYKWIFGAYDASKRLAIGSGDSESKRTFGYNASTSYNSSTYYTMGAHIFLADSTGASIDGHNFFGFADFSTTSHIILYTIPITLSRYCSNARIWSYKHYRNGTLVRDIQPVRFTNELGQAEGAMYDRVSRKLFRNQGTRSFVVGPDVAVPVMGLHFMRRPRYMAKDYVQTGLVAMWDGIENAGWGVHANSPSDWTSLVGNGETILLQDHFVYSFDSNSLLTTGSAGVNTQYLTVPVIANLLNTSEWTVEVMAQCMATNTALIASYPWGSGGYFQIQRGNNVAYLIATGMTGSKLFSGTGDATNGYMASYTLRYKDNVLYRDWMVVGESDARHDTLEWTKPALKTTNYSIGQNNKYHFIRLYSRALTAAEIAANYAIDKARFNLP